MDKDRGLVVEEKPIMKMRRKPETTEGLLQDQEYLPLQKECNLLDMRVKFMRLRSCVFIQ
jgi:hypothetical protein